MIDAGDQHHVAAARFVHANRHALFWLPEAVFVETMVLMKARLGAAAAVALGERIRSSTHFLVVEPTAEDRQAAWAIFSRYIDKDWSYVDCSILALARRLEVNVVFAFDRHFDQMPAMTRLPT